TLAPARVRAGPGWSPTEPSAAATPATRSSSSARRPGPTSPEVSGPEAGGTTRTPRASRVARLARVAGCSHISVCMAGATTTGPPKARAMLVSRSSARPAASRARVLAVAGATTRTWPQRARATCSTPAGSSHTEAGTRRPVRAAKVARLTIRSPDSVSRGWTPAPARITSRATPRAAGGGGEGGPGDHPLAGLGQQGLDLGPGPHQLAGQLGRLVGGDPAGHPQQPPCPGTHRPG